tara:strand:- start:26355 stop:26660 length:306 start_codon:yes stop_codon:yes gene_type:complete
MSNQNSKKKNSEPKSSGNKNESDHLKLIEKWRVEILKLSYEESLNRLDQILLNLQNEKLHIDDIQVSYLKANILLERCENLLAQVEQEVIEINPDLLMGKE